MGQSCELLKPKYEDACGSLKLTSLQKFKEVGDCFEMEVRAASTWNASGLRFIPNEKYEIEVLGENPTWKDGDIDDVSPTGWTNNHRELEGKNLLKFFLPLVEPLRRDSKNDWFYLMGATASVEYRQFPIGTGISYAPKVEGEFCAFANDLYWMYGNNEGSLNIRVTRVVN